MLPGTPLPRLLDMGQCNDAYSALVVAMVSTVLCSGAAAAVVVTSGAGSCWVPVLTGRIPGRFLVPLLIALRCFNCCVVPLQELAKAFNTDVNGLPLSLDISW